MPVAVVTQLFYVLWIPGMRRKTLSKVAGDHWFCVPVIVAAKWGPKRGARPWRWLMGYEDQPHPHPILVFALVWVLNMSGFNLLTIFFTCFTTCNQKESPRRRHECA